MQSSEAYAELPRSAIQSRPLLVYIEETLFQEDLFYIIIFSSSSSTNIFLPTDEDIEVRALPLQYQFSKMPLLALPNEILLLISFFLDGAPYDFKFQHINRLLQTCRQLRDLMNPYLYKLDVEAEFVNSDYRADAISLAIYQGTMRTAQKALNAGAGVYPCDLQHATAKPALDIFTLLLDAGEWSDEELLSGLLDAAGEGQPEIVREYLLRGVDPSLALPDRCPPLTAAVEYGHAAVVDILLTDPRTDPNVRCQLEDQTVLQRAAEQSDTQIVEALLARGASARPNVQHPMHSAIINRNPEMLALFIHRADVDPNAIYNGSTPLQCAVGTNCDSLVEVLLRDPRVDPNLTVVNARTPLFEAAALNNREMCRHLLGAGGDPSITDRGLSPAVLITCSDQMREALLRQHKEGLPQPSEERRKRPRRSTITVR